MRTHARHDTTLATLAVALLLCTPTLAPAQTGGCERMAADGCMALSFENCADAATNDSCHKSYYIRYSCSKPVRWRAILDSGDFIIHFMGDGYVDEIHQLLTNVWDFGESPVVRGMECCDGETFGNCKSDPDLWN